MAVRTSILENELRNWFYSDRETELSEEAKQLYKETLFVWNCLLDRVLPQMIVKQCKKMFGMNRPATYTRINFANKIFGGAIELDKKAEREIMKQSLYQALKWATDARDYKAMDKLNNTLANILNLKGEDAIIPHFENIQPQDIKLVASKKEEEVMQKLLDSGSLDVDLLSEAMDKIARSKKVEAEDIEYEEV